MRISINPVQTSHGRKRSGGRPALQLPRAHFPADVPHTASLPTAHRRSWKFLHRYRLLQSEEVWRATGPPAPTSTLPRRCSAYRLPPDRAPQKSEIPASVLSSSSVEVETVFKFKYLQTSHQWYKIKGEDGTGAHYYTVCQAGDSAGQA